MTRKGNFCEGKNILWVFQFYTDELMVTIAYNQNCEHFFPVNFAAMVTKEHNSVNISTAKHCPLEKGNSFLCCHLFLLVSIDLSTADITE